MNDEWKPFENGTTVGERGSEEGAIAEDYEHALGARITLEQGAEHAPFTITCGIYGWMVHTRFFGSDAEAKAQLTAMKSALVRILDAIPLESDPRVDEKADEVTRLIRRFVEEFP